MENTEKIERYLLDKYGKVTITKGEFGAELGMKRTQLSNFIKNNLTAHTIFQTSGIWKIDVFTAAIFIAQITKKEIK